MAIPNILSLGFLVPRVAHAFDPSGAIRGLRGMPRSLTLVGQKLAAGSVAAGVLTQVTTESAAIALLGEGSQLLEMWRGAKQNSALGLPIKVIALDAGAGAVAATGTITVTVSGGSATYVGQLGIYVGGRRVSAVVAIGDTPTLVAGKIAAAITADSKMSVTAANTAGVVKLTAKWAGKTGNDINVRVGYYDDELLGVKGVTTAIAAMSSGAGTPSVSPVIDALDGQRATEIAVAFTDSAFLAPLEVELESRWGPMSMIDGQVVFAIRGTEGEITTALNSRNSPMVHCITVYKDMTSPWVTAAMAGAAIESHASLDPAVPFTGLPLSGYLPCRQDDDWTVDQQNVFLVAGGSPLLVAGGKAELLRMVTNYTQNSLGAQDASYRNLNWIKTLSYYRWFCVTEFQTKYRGYKLAEYISEPIPGQKLMTSELGAEIMSGIYDKFREVALMQNEDYYRKTLLVEVDGTYGKLKIIDDPVLVTQHYQTEITSKYIAGHV